MIHSNICFKILTAMVILVQYTMHGDHFVQFTYIEHDFKVFLVRFRTLLIFV